MEIIDILQILNRQTTSNVYQTILKSHQWSGLSITKHSSANPYSSYQLLNFTQVKLWTTFSRSSSFIHIFIHTSSSILIITKNWYSSNSKSSNYVQLMFILHKRSLNHINDQDYPSPNIPQFLHPILNHS